MSPARSPVQVCPICQAQHSLEATRCSECGAALAGAPVMNAPVRERKTPGPLDGPGAPNWEEGEADLHEGLLPAAWTQLAVAVVMFLLVMAGGAGVVYVAQQSANATPTPDELTLMGLSGTQNPGEQPTL